MSARAGSAAFVAGIVSLFAMAALAELGWPGPAAVVIPLAALNLAFIAVALSAVRGYNLVVSLVCLAASAAIAAAYKVPTATTLAAFNKSAAIAAFVAAIPVVALPIRLGGYVGAMEAFVAGSGGASRRGKAAEALKYLTLTAVHFLMSVVLNIGSIPTMQRLLGRTGLSKRYLAAIYSAGYSCYMVLSPFDGLVNAILITAGTTYAAHFPGGLAMAAAIFGVGCATVIVGASRRAPEAPIQAPAAEIRAPVGPRDGADPAVAAGAVDARRAESPALMRSTPAGRILEFAAHLCAMIALSAAAGAFLPIRNRAVSMALVIIAYSSLWLAMLGVKPASLRGQGRLYVADLLGYRAFLPFLISAGFLGAMGAYTPLGGALGRFVESMSFLPKYFTLQAIMLAVAVLCVAGVHMMITVVALSTTLSPAILGISPPGFSLFLLSAWFVGMILSPFVPYVTVVAGEVGEKPSKVGLRYDLPLALAMLVIAPLIIR